MCSLQNEKRRFFWVACSGVLVKLSHHLSGARVNLLLLLQVPRICKRCRVLCLTRCVLQKQYAVVQRYADDTQQMQHAALCVVAAAMQYLASLSCPAPLDCHPKTWGSLFVRGLDLYQHDSAVMQGWAVLDTAVRAWLPLVAIMAPDAQRQYRLALGAQALFVCADEEVTTFMFKYIALPHLRARIRPCCWPCKPCTWS